MTEGDKGRGQNAALWRLVRRRQQGERQGVVGRGFQLPGQPVDGGRRTPIVVPEQSQRRPGYLPQVRTTPSATETAGAPAGPAPTAEPASTQETPAPAGPQRRRRPSRDRGARAAVDADTHDGNGQPKAAEPVTDTPPGSVTGQTGTEVQDREQPAAAAGGPPNGGRGPRETTFAEPGPEPDPPAGDDPREEDTGVSGDEARNTFAGRSRRRRHRPRSAADDRADPATAAPAPPVTPAPVPDEIVDAVIVDDEPSGRPARPGGRRRAERGRRPGERGDARADTKAHAVDLLAAGRRREKLPAKRMEDDPRWRDAFHQEMDARYRPPDNPAQLGETEYEAHLAREAAAMRQAEAAANAALPENVVEAYRRFGDYAQPRRDPALREALHLDEGGPSLEDLAAIVKRFPEKAALHQDYLRFLESQARAGQPGEPVVPVIRHEDLQDREPEVTVTVDAGVQDEFFQKLSREDAVLQLKENREERGLADRMEHDPRWLDVFSAVYNPPDVPEGDPSKLDPAVITRWIAENEARMQTAREAADMVMPDDLVEAYRRFGQPFANPDEDPAVRDVLHLDNPTGPRTPEGDPKVTETKIADQPSGAMRRKTRPTLTDLAQPEVTVHMDDLAEFRRRYPEKAAIYEDFLAQLEEQGIYEMKVYPRYNPVLRLTPGGVFDQNNRPRTLDKAPRTALNQFLETGEAYVHDPEDVLVPDSVLLQAKYAWEDADPRHWGATPPKFREPQPQAQPGMRQRLYMRANERYAGRARHRMHPRPAEGKLVQNPDGSFRYQRNGKRKIGETARELHDEFRDMILTHHEEDQAALAATIPAPQRSRLHRETGRTGFRRGLGRGFRPSQPRNLHRPVGVHHAEGRVVEERIRDRSLKSENGELTLGHVLGARRDVRRARRVNKGMHTYARNVIHHELFPKRSNPHATAHRQREKIKFQGDPWVQPAFETPQQRRKRRTQRNIQRWKAYRERQRARDAAVTSVASLKQEKEKIKNDLKETTIFFNWITRRALHSRLNDINRELRHARVRAFQLHPVVRAAAKGGQMVGALV